jgi:HAE1 family hydrophobic/amphiphilic exporter-1
LDQTDAYVMQLEEILDTLPEVSRYSARVGSARFMGLPMQGGVSNRARIRVKVHPSHADSIETLMDQLRSRISGLNEDAQVFMKRENLLQTAGMESRLELVVEGSDRAQIAEISKQAIQRLEQLPFLSDIQYTLEGTRPEIHIGVDHGNILQQGVSVYQVAKTLRLAIEGVPVARIPLGDEFIQMILTYDRAELVTTNDLAKLGFYNPGGNWLRLGDVAQFEQAYGPASITRQNRMITGEIHAEFSGIDMSGARDLALAALADMDLPEGCNIRVSGAFALLDDVFSDLWLVLGVAAILVYLVMSAQFESFLNPFIIICSLPPAYAGSIFALILTGSSLSIPAMIGGIVLAGILVNDGIVLIDLISQKHREGQPLNSAVIQGATARLRPVLMTTITTVLGVLPLALGLGAGSQLQTPMGLTIIGGQVVGTALLLIIVPVLYSLFNRRKEESP